MVSSTTLLAWQCEHRAIVRTYTGFATNHPVPGLTLALLVHGRREGTPEHEGPISWPAGRRDLGRMHRWIGRGDTGTRASDSAGPAYVLHRTKIRSFHGSKARALIPATNLVWRSDVRVTRHGMCKAAPARCMCRLSRDRERRSGRPAHEPSPRPGWAGCWVGEGAG
jgi:hypothetical protein